MYCNNTILYEYQWALFVNQTYFLFNELVRVNICIAHCYEDYVATLLPTTIEDLKSKHQQLQNNHE